MPVSLDTVCNTLAKLLTQDEARRIAENVVKLGACNSARLSA
jgi:hypothetical protein